MTQHIINKIFRFKHLRASSLANAIFVCLIISVFCGCLVLISHYNNLLNNKLYEQEDLIDRSISAFNYSMNNPENFPYGIKKNIDVFEDGILSVIEKKHWGFYDVFICKTGIKNDSVTKIALIGQKSKAGSDLALYVTNYDKPLKLSGETKIFGKIKVPNGRTEQAYLNGQKGNAINLKGQQFKSAKRLPLIDKDIAIDLSEYKLLDLKSLEHQKLIINSFANKTKVIDLTNIKELGGITCKGNIILASKNKLKILNTANLSDVIIQAPEIEIQSGFRGNIQIQSKKNVTVEEHVSLLYPSTISVENDLDSISVVIKDNVKIAGGLVINSNSHFGATNRNLIIHKKATVVGTIYCNGKTQLEGKVIGSVYTDKFFLKTKSSSYENVVLNGTINRDSLPERFINLPLFNKDLNERKYGIVKEF